MMGVMLVILTFLWITSAESQTQSAYKCVSSSNGDDVKLHITNRRNQTGHSMSQVEFEHKIATSQNSLAKKEKNLWTVDVEQRTESCEGVEFTSRLIFTVTAPLQTRSDYEHFPGLGYYKFHALAATWPRAREICAEEGSHLVIINSEQEDDIIKKLFARHPQIIEASNQGYAWVGVRELQNVNGEYVTIFDVSLNKTGFTRFHAGEEDNKGMGDFIMVYRNGELGDVPAAFRWKLAFTCETEIV